MPKFTPLGEGGGGSSIGAGLKGAVKILAPAAVAAAIAAEADKEHIKGQVDQYNRDRKQGSQPNHHVTDSKNHTRTVK